MFTHMLVPLATDAESVRTVFPAAAMARAFDATVVVVAHPSSGVDPADVVDRVGTADVAAVRLDADADIAESLRRLAPAFASSLVVCGPDLAESMAAGWPGPVLIFGAGADPDGYAVGGTILVDAAVHATGDPELMELGRAIGFETEAVDDVTTAPRRTGVVIVPRRNRTDDVAHLVAEWPGPVYLLGTGG